MPRRCGCIVVVLYRRLVAYRVFHHLLGYILYMQVVTKEFMDQIMAMAAAQNFDVSGLLQDPLIPWLYIY